MKKKLSVAMFSFVICILLAACHRADLPLEEGGVEQTGFSKTDSMEKVAILSYEVPTVQPSILVSFRGYQSKREKKAVFLSTRPIEFFEVRQADSNQTVLSGSLTTGKTDNIYYGDFTLLTEEGEYYLFAKGIGASKSFHVCEAFFDEQFNEITDAIKDKARDNTASLNEIAQLLQLYEWYPELFQDEDENGIPQMLEFVAGWSEREESKSILTAGVLAKFSYLFQNYDRKLATKILNKASSLFEQERKAQGEDSQMFFALTELYRATGKEDLRREIQEYHGYFGKNPDFLYHQGYLYGTMTYISTYQKTDLELCELLMGQLNSKAEENARSFSELISPVDGKNNGPEEVLKRACVVMAANYIMNNPEYNHVVEETWDYFAGKNASSTDYLEETQDYAGYLMLAGQLYAVQDRL